MDIGSILRRISGGKQSPEEQKKNQGRPKAALEKCGEIVPLEVIQDKGQTDEDTERYGETDLMLRLTKEPNQVYVEERRFVDWISQEEAPQFRRIPRPCRYKYAASVGFRVGEMEYRNVGELRNKVLDRERQLYCDIYGRIFAEERERFPCFDSFDYEAENRYYHWLYLTENGKLFLVYYEDGGGEITVTEDVGEIGAVSWHEMVRLGWVENVEVQTLTGFLGAPENAEQ